MHGSFRFFFFNVLLAVCAACFCGCGKKAAPYDSLRGEILENLTTALSDNNSPAVLKALDRLEPLTDSDEFIISLREQEQTRAVIMQLNQILETGEIKQAQRVINRPNTKASPLLEDLSRKINGLAALRDYLGNHPYTDSKKMWEALENVKAHSVSFLTYPEFQTWLKAQEQTIARRRQNERQIELERLLDVCDQAVNAQAIDADIAFVRLMAFSSDTPAGKLQNSLRQGNPHVALKLMDATTPPSEIELKSLEVCLLYNQPDLPPKIFEKLIGKLPDRPPQSLSGHVLRVLRLVNETRPAEALWAFRQYIQAARSSKMQMTELASQAVLPPEYFNARPWRITCPTVDTVFAIFTQWHDFHSSGERGK